MGAPAVPDHPIIVVGAGIGGLTAALSLSRHGRAVTIVEAFEAPSEIGAGLQVPPNACHVLDRLGLLEALKAKASIPDRICLGDAVTGRIVLTLDANRSGHADDIYLTAHRALLHGVLYDAACRDPAITMLTGHRVVDAREEETKVTLTAAHGGEKVELEASAVIGADGIWSMLRHAVPGAGAPQPTGRIAMRAVVPAPPESQSNAVIAWMAPHAHLVTYPVRNAETRNLVAVVRGKVGRATWSEHVDFETLENLFEKLARTPYGDLGHNAAWTAWPLYTVDPQGAWHSDRICLLGDAAHGLEPFAAQGAAMAIEDGHVLARAIAEFGADHRAAFASYHAERADRVRRVAKRTAFNRFTYHQAGIGRIARNLSFRMRPASAFKADLDWLYGYRA
ncbi:MAG: FAD-dependent monooxygenase [Roseitalea porphyridii]|uniref:FAD-dependent monooxygenase n=1 Tax=Roseitalea porphyridii TaxID=1852022 RepID=UPI0032D8B4E3